MNKRRSNPNFIRKRFLVKQEEIAEYLGISESLYSMAERNERELPPAVSLKLTMLEVHCIQSEQTKLTGKSRSALQNNLHEQAIKYAGKLLGDATYYRAKSGVLQSSLDKLISQQEEQLLWLDILDYKIGTLTGEENSGKDKKWFEYMHTVTINRIGANDKAITHQQFKIEMLKMKAEMYEKHHHKISNRVSSPADSAD